jgi:hypothetical protein
VVWLCCRVLSLRLGDAIGDARWPPDPPAMPRIWRPADLLGPRVGVDVAGLAHEGRQGLVEQQRVFLTAAEEESSSGAGSTLRHRGSGFSARRSEPTPDDEVSDGDLHRLVALIQRRGLHLDDALIGARFGGPYLEHFDL